jgi:hypothetical protein
MVREGKVPLTRMGLISGNISLNAFPVGPFPTVVLPAATSRKLHCGHGIPAMREASPVPPPSTWGALNTEAYMIEKANLAEKLRLFSDHFAPRTVSQFNGHDVMVAKLKGPFVWHKHDDTDDLLPRAQGNAGHRAARPHGHARGRGGVRRPQGRGAPAGGEGRGASASHRADRHPQHGRRGHGGSAADGLSAHSAFKRARPHLPENPG